MLFLLLNIFALSAQIQLGVYLRSALGPPVDPNAKFQIGAKMLRAVKL
jgi:hypothetical protein